MRSVEILAVCSLLPLGASACAATAAGEVKESYIQTRDGALLHYRLVGEGSALIVVPGESLQSPDLDRLARGRRLLYYDLRNRGRSGLAASAHLENDLRDLEAVLDWFELPQVTLLGFDYQAALVAQFAVRHPERVERLVLISPLPPRKFPYWGIYERVFNERVDAESFQRLRELAKSGARRLEPQAWADAYRESILSGWVVDKASLKRMQASPLVEPNLDPEPLLRQYRNLLGALGDWDWRADLGQVACPALVVAGSADPVPEESHAEWASSLPLAERSRIDRSARLSWIERPAEFFAAVEAFLGSPP